MSKHGFHLDMWGQESKVRGIYLSIATECEFFMDRITSKCEEIDPTKREYFKLNLPYEMGAKLKRCISALSTYNISYYNSFKTTFDEIEQLSKYRNMLAHGYSRFDIKEQDVSFMEMVWVEGPKNNRVRSCKMILIKPFLKEILKYRQTVYQMWGLHDTLCKERGED